MNIQRAFLTLICLCFGASFSNAQLAMPLTFDEAMTFTFTDFGPDVENDGRPTDKVTTVAADPDAAENMVAAAIKPAGAQTWSGVTFWDATKVPVSESETRISVRVRTPAANTPILLKIENNLSPSHFVEKIVNSTKAGEWEILTFDYASPTGGELDFNELLPVYNRISIFFNFGAGGGATDTTYHFEDVTLGAPEILNLPFDFESDTLAYDFGEGGGFGGGVSTIIDNPQMVEPNTSAKVAQMVKNAPETWAGSTLVLDGPLNFGNGSRISLDVFSPRAGVPVLMKLEGAVPAEVSMDTTMANAWETLTYDFAGKTAAEYTGISLFFDFGTAGDGSANFTFLFDNLQLAPELVTLPLDFENDSVFYLFNNFGGAAASRVANPDASGINTSDFVGCAVKSAPEVWAGSTMNFPGGLDFSESSVFKMKVWSPRAGVPVLFKLEPSGDPAIEVSVNTTVANAWEELTFDFTGQTDGELNGISFFFDFGAVGDGTENFTFYFDDVALEGVGGGLDPVVLPVTFDSGVGYGLTDFGNMAPTVIGDDPVEGASNPVAIATRPDNAETWAGTTVGEPDGFASPFPFSHEATQISVRIYAPAMGIPVRLKVENAANNAISAETEATTTVANMWETLVFDFGQPAEGTSAVSLDNTYNKVSIFFNFGTAGATAGEQIFYWDDIIWTGETNEGLGGPARPSLPITFQLPPEEVDYTVTDFEGNVSVIGADPVDATNVAVATQKSGNAKPWAGTTMSTPAGLAEAIPVTATNTKMSVRVYSPDANIPVRLKIEDKDDATHSVETEAMTTVANEWETLVFDFANEATGTAALNLDYTFNLASIFFNFGTTGADAGEKIYYWDDVMFVETADDTPRAVGEDAGSNTITLAADPTPDVVVGLLVFDDGGNELGKIASIAGRVLTLKNPLAIAIPANARLTFVVDNTPVTSGGQLVNISTRGQVGSADAALFASFVIGKDTQQVLINGIGADELTTVPGALVDPILEIRNAATNELMDSNDSWESDQKDAINALWPTDRNPLKDGSKAAGILITLPTGQWSAILRGVGDTTGVGQIEVFEVD
ncbi:MAG: hypothetical protein O3C43_11945 [Verrucomicrobia bacterium]|nr:hypothetical protein [Verrucomicrobiota bacterium]